MKLLPKILLIVLIAFVTVALLLAILLGSFRYVYNYQKHLVISEASSDGQYELKIYQIGDPDWPFGHTHCRFVLSDNGKTIVKEDFDIADDGCIATPENFTVRWFADSVKITVRGQEQPDMEHILCFDGQTK